MIDKSSKSALAIGKLLRLHYLRVESNSLAPEADTVLLCSRMAPEPLEKAMSPVAARDATTCVTIRYCKPRIRSDIL